MLVLISFGVDVGRHDPWVRDQYLETKSFERCGVLLDELLDRVLGFHDSQTEELEELKGRALLHFGDHGEDLVADPRDAWVDRIAQIIINDLTRVNEPDRQFSKTGAGEQ